MWNNFHCSTISSKKFHIISAYEIKIHGHVSAAKKAMWHISVLSTGTTNSPFSTPCISIITGPISIKSMYFMCSIYVTLYNLKEISPVVYGMFSWKFAHFLHSSLLLRTVLQKYLWANQRHPSHGSISFKFGTPIRHFVAYLSLHFGDI